MSNSINLSIIEGNGNTINQNNNLSNIELIGIAPKIDDYFIGREQETQYIIDWVNNNQSNVLNVYGEGGIGKTSLISSNKLLKNFNDYSFVEHNITNPDQDLFSSIKIINSRGEDIIGEDRLKFYNYYAKDNKILHLINFDSESSQLQLNNLKDLIVGQAKAIVTSRAEIPSTDETYIDSFYLKQLSDQKLAELFCQRYYNKSFESISSEKKDIIYKIVSHPNLLSNTLIINFLAISTKDTRDNNIDLIKSLDLILEMVESKEFSTKITNKSAESLMGLLMEKFKIRETLEKEDLLDIILTIFELKFKVNALLISKILKIETKEAYKKLENLYALGLINLIATSDEQVSNEYLIYDIVLMVLKQWSQDNEKYAVLESKVLINLYQFICDFDGYNYSELGIDYERVKVVLNKLSKFYEDYSFTQEEANIPQLLGFCYNKLNLIKESINQFTISKKMWKELYNKEPDKYSYNYATVCMNLGTSFSEINEIKLAVKEKEIAKPIFEKLYNKEPDRYSNDYATICMNLGITYFDQSNIDLALKEHLIAKPIFEKLYNKEPDKYSYNYTTVCMNLGYLYINQSNIDLALKEYLIVKEVWNELYIKEPNRYSKHYATICMNLGNAYSNNNNNLALKEYLIAKEVWNELYIKEPNRYSDDYAGICTNLWNTYRIQNNIDLAIEEHLIAKEIKNGLSDK